MSETIGFDSNRTARELDRLKADIERLRSDFHAIGHDLGGAVRSGADQAKSFAKESTEAAANRLRKSKEFVESSVTDHPLISISLALAAGVIAGTMLAKRDGSCD